MRVLIAVFVLLLSLLFLLLTVFYDRPALSAERPKVDAAIVFVIDRSDSMHRDEKAIVKLGHMEALRSDEVLGAIQNGYHQRIGVAYVEFGNDAVVKVPWHVVNDLASANDFIDKFFAQEPRPKSTGGTSITSGLEVAHQLLLSLPYDATKVVVDVTGDGKHNYTLVPTPDQIRASIIDLGATINGLPVVVDPDGDPTSYYEQHIIGGPRSFNLPVRGYDEYPMRIRQKLLLELF